MPQAVKDISARKDYLKKCYKACLWSTACLLMCVLLFLMLDHLFPLKVEISYSQSIQDHQGNTIHLFLSKDQKWRIQASNNEISPLVKKVFIAKEDQYFYYHYGFNVLSIVRALVNNTLKRKTTSGASTITMQVSRLLVPKRRTYSNKLIEIFRAIQLENRYTKDEILNLYFNLIPYGGNVEGIKSVSLLYLQKKTHKLSLAEAMALAIIPNRPSSLNIKKRHERIVEERNKWLLLLQDKGLFPAKDIEDALKEPFDPTYKPLPLRIPHLALKLRRRFSQSSNIHTYIQQERQYRAQEILYNYVKNLEKYHIYNGAVLVIDNSTQGVVSYVGSNDFFDAEHAGQCDGIAAIRSPGSTLKPLLYALALDKGQLTMQTIVEDIPCDIKGYAPQNFDKKFRGRISVETALLYSLNIPAVRVLDQYGVKDFISHLEALHCNQIKKDKDKLGHSVILGGCGTTLEELCGLYVSFARRGSFCPLHLAKPEGGAKAQKNTPMVSAAAAFVITQALSKLTRPDIPNNAENMMNTAALAWKTGTSYGKRDAWSIGYTPHYTVGVWLGNFDNSPVSELVGIDLAAPLLFEIFSGLGLLRPHQGYTQPAALQSRIVCTESGLPPDYFCKSFTSDLFLPGISSHASCDHLKEYSVSQDEKISYCIQCRPENGYKKVLYPNLTADLIHYYDHTHTIYKKVPEHNKACQSNFIKASINIVHPQQNKTYYTDEDLAQIKLECATGPSVKYVYWYVNDKFMGRYAKDAEVFVKLKIQKNRISCTDDLGNTDHVDIDIQKM